MARRRASMREGPLAELFRATEAAQRQAEKEGRVEEAAPAPVPGPAVGSVKANLGHTKAAAGLAGLLKAVLAVGHQVLPPNTGCDEPHPAVEQAGLRTLGQPEVWPAGRVYK